MQEARFAGACQDKHAGRPAPSLGWPGERKSIGATSRGKRRFWQKQISRCNKSRLGLPEAWGPGLGAGASRGLGPGPLGAWGPGHQSGLPGEAGTPYPPARPPSRHFCKRKRRGFSPSPLLKPSNAPPKVGGFWGY